MKFFRRLRRRRGIRSHLHAVYSQNGEDGLIAFILDRARERGVDVVPWCCEFGALDGKKASNTYHLVESQGFQAVYIEPDAEKFEALQKTAEENPGRIITLNTSVGWKDSDACLDAILAATPIPRDFFCLSIDVDGPDYWIWKSFIEYEPRIVIIETHSVYPPEESVVYQEGIRHGDRGGSTSFKPMLELGLSKKYVPVAYTGNLIFCHEDLFERVLGDSFPSDFDYDELYRAHANR